MMRKGKIALINHIDNLGVILDENDQEVLFYLENLKERLSISDNVVFEIELTEQGLAAVQVSRQPVKLINC